MRWVAVMLAWVWAGTAWAIGGNDRLEITLNTGEQVQGWYYDLRGEHLLLSGDNRVADVPLALVAQVQMNGQPISVAELMQELEGVRALQSALLADPPPHPRSGVAIALSLGWAGAGHAALGDWKSFAGYSVVEAALLGTGAYNLARGSKPGVLIPITALDILFKGYAAADSGRIARGRRAQLGLRHDVPPSQLEQGLDFTSDR